MVTENKVVTVGRGRVTHAWDGRTWDQGSRTVCGLLWTDEHPAEAGVSCRRCCRIGFGVRVAWDTLRDTVLAPHT